uniref:Putative ovule protein n=1 Tax=Solanum chacoense TaxID=4108 RepID=A0A0V0GVD7_SOLCH
MSTWAKTIFYLKCDTFRSTNINHEHYIKAREETLSNLRENKGVNEQILSHDQLEMLYNYIS